MTRRGSSEGSESRSRVESDLQSVVVEVWRSESTRFSPQRPHPPFHSPTPACFHNISSISPSTHHRSLSQSQCSPLSIICSEYFPLSSTTCPFAPLVVSSSIQTPLQSACTPPKSPPPSSPNSNRNAPTAVANSDQRKDQRSQARPVLKTCKRTHHFHPSTSQARL